MLLVERDDLGSGTSSWSSRLIHGGLKYLEKLDVKLVRESLREREWLLGAAPHLVHPLRMVMPAYRGAHHGPAALWAGMIAYDVLSWDKSVPATRLEPGADARSVPGLEREGLLGAATYFDAQAELRRAARASRSPSRRGAQSATILTHASVDGLEVRAGRIRGVTVTDGLTARRTAAQGAVVLNMAGPWVDQVLERGAAATSSSSAARRDRTSSLTPSLARRATPCTTRAPTAAR